MTKPLPSTLAEIRAIAAHWFKDKAVVSVNVQATWGHVTVERNGEIRMA